MVWIDTDYLTLTDVHQKNKRIRTFQVRALVAQEGWKRTSKSPEIKRFQGFLLTRNDVVKSDKIL